MNCKRLTHAAVGHVSCISNTKSMSWVLVSPGPCQLLQLSLSSNIPKVAVLYAQRPPKQNGASKFPNAIQKDLQNDQVPRMCCQAGTRLRRISEQFEVNDGCCPRFTMFHSVTTSTWYLHFTWQKKWTTIIPDDIWCPCSHLRISLHVFRRAFHQVQDLSHRRINGISQQLNLKPNEMQNNWIWNQLTFEPIKLHTPSSYRFLIFGNFRHRLVR